MPSHCLSLGGLVLRLSGGTSASLAMRLPGMRVFQAADATADIHFSLDAPFAEAEGELLWQFHLLEGQALCRLFRTAPGRYRYIVGAPAPDRPMSVSFSASDPARAELSAPSSALQLRFALWLAYSLAGLFLGRIPIHASAVVCEGRAVACLGESGTGKSTHTRLWTEHVAGSFLLNDDSPILALTPGGILLHGSPWSGKSPCFRQEAYPLAALVRIEQRPHNRIARLGALDAFTAFQPSCPPSLVHDPLLTDRLFGLLSRVVEEVPVYRLGCRPDAEAATLCRHAVIAD